MAVPVIDTSVEQSASANWLSTSSCVEGAVGPALATMRISKCVVVVCVHVVVVVVVGGGPCTCDNEDFKMCGGGVHVVVVVVVGGGWWLAVVVVVCVHVCGVVWWCGGERWALQRDNSNNEDSKCVVWCVCVRACMCSVVGRDNKKRKSRIISFLARSRSFGNARQKAPRA